ncbi:unnamed protein product [Hermetia illucens]|nr:unnamed protein product [Hermetia illucens]
MLNAREIAPMAANLSMFANPAISGGLSVAVPGEIKGYYALHQKYGVLKWEELFKPAIQFCEEGIPVSEYLAARIQQSKRAIMNSPSLKELFVDPATNKPYQTGDLIKNLKLGKTLRVLAEEGEDAIYHGGSIGKMLVDDIQSHGGIVTEEDFRQYSVQWGTPATTQIKDCIVHTVPFPGSGPLLNFILNLINENITSNHELLWHRIIEAFKHGFGLRTCICNGEYAPVFKELFSLMSSKDFAAEIFPRIKDDRTFDKGAYYGANNTLAGDRGTANVAVLGPNGDAITVTSTINALFGSKTASQQTGIILNDEMDDFSTPGKLNNYSILPLPANFVRPRERPLSSMVPTIVLDEHKDPRLILGAAGGPKITTAVAQVIIRHLLLEEPLDQAIQAPRLHHQLHPMYIQYESGFDEKILESLKAKGHVLKMRSGNDGFSAVTAITVASKKDVQAVYDKRRPGSVAYYE